jgi:hypothetical protein
MIFLKIRIIISIFIYFLGIFWGIKEFISGNGFFSLVSVLFLSFGIGILFFPGRSNLPNVFEVLSTIGAITGFIAFLYHSPMFDVDKEKSEIDIHSYIMEQMMMSRNLKGNTEIPDDIEQKMLTACIMQGPQDQFTTARQALELQDPDEVAFAKKATGNDFQPEDDKCIPMVKEVNEKFPGYFGGIQHDVDKLISDSIRKKKSIFVW